MPITQLLAVLVLVAAAPTVSAQKLDPDDRIGSAVGLCEGMRFDRISGLLEAGKLTEKQAYERWKRITSDTVAVRALLDDAAKDGELTSAQIDKLMPLLDMKFVARPLAGRRDVGGTFGVNKSLPAGTFKGSEFSQESRDKIFKRLVAANKRGVIYDYDVSSIMLALYTGWDWREHTPEQEYAYNLAIKPRWLQAEEGGFMRKDTVIAGYARKRGGAAGGARGRAGYGKAALKIEDPAEWTKALSKPIFSGPQPGEKLPPFKAVGLSGTRQGQEFDAVSLAGEKLHLMIFAKEARTFGRFLTELARQLEAGLGDVVHRRQRRPERRGEDVRGDQASAPHHCGDGAVDGRVGWPAGLRARPHAHRDGHRREGRQGPLQPALRERRLLLAAPHPGGHRRRHGRRSRRPAQVHRRPSG